MKKKYKLIGMMIALLMGIASVIAYNKSSLHMAKYYVEALSDRNYEAMYEVLLKEEKVLACGEEKITDYFRRYFEQNKLEEVQLLERLDVIDGQALSPDVVCYEVRYLFDHIPYTSRLYMVHEHDTWEVLFPFAITDVEIEAPVGTSVYFDGEIVRPGINNEYWVRNVLPGIYDVEMDFYYEAYPRYEVRIQVPVETQVSAPYERAEAVDTVPLAEEVVINEASIAHYIEDFYHTYEEGIKARDQQLIVQYLADENKAQIVDSYSQWFIEGKQIQEVQLDYQIEEMTIGDDGKVAVSLCEIVELMNEEGEGDDDAADVLYRVVLTTTLAIEWEEDGYKIKDKTIEESIVAQLDEVGEWLSY